LGTQLLLRTTRSLTLTEAGHSYFERCRRALEEIESAERCLENLQDEPRGLLKVTAPSDLGAPLLDELVLAFTERHPQVRVHVDLSNRYVDLVSEGYDVAIRAGPLQDSSLIARRIAGDDIVFVASPDYLEQHPAPVTLEQLSAHDLLLGTETGHEQALRLTGPNGELSVRLQARITASGIALLERCALRGAGIALLPLIGVREHLRSGRLVRVLPEFARTGGAISIVYPSVSQSLPKTRAFVELAVEHLTRVVGA
jgi:DNA-binding transcriptional LysR family regulator